MYIWLVLSTSNSHYAPHFEKKTQEWLKVYALGKGVSKVLVIELVDEPTHLKKYAQVKSDHLPR